MTKKFLSYITKNDGMSLMGSMLALALLITIASISMRFVSKQISVRRSINASTAHKTIYQAIELETGSIFRNLFNDIATSAGAFPNSIIDDKIQISTIFELMPEKSIDFKNSFGEIKFVNANPSAPKTNIVVPDHIQKIILDCNNSTIPLLPGHQFYFQCMQLNKMPGTIDNKSKSISTLAKASHAFVVFSVQFVNARNFSPTNVFEWSTAKAGIAIVDWTLYWRHETKDGKGIYHYRTNNYYLLSGS
jgi:hypothetical protein